MAALNEDAFYCIIAYLNDPSDVVNVGRTCRTMFLITARFISRDVKWAGYKQFQGSDTFFRLHPEYTSFTRRLTISVAYNPFDFRPYTDYPAVPAGAVFTAAHTLHQLAQQHNLAPQPPQPLVQPPPLPPPTSYQINQAHHGPHIAPHGAHMMPLHANQAGVHQHGQQGNALHHHYHPHHHHHHHANNNAPGSWQDLLHMHAQRNVRLRTVVFNAQMYNRLQKVAKAFVHLEELTFCDALLPIHFIPLLQAFTELKRLHIERCVLPADHSIHKPDHLADDAIAQGYTVLPITHLTLLKNSAGASYRQGTKSESYLHSLVTSPNLRFLRLEAIADLPRMFLGSGALPVPSRLHTLHLVLESFGEVFNEKETAMVMRARDFMMQCRSLQQVKVEQCKGYALFMRQLNLPKFRSFCGPMLLAQDALENRTLHNLEIINVVRLDNLSRMFDMAPQYTTSLTSLSLIINRWDMELLHAVVTVFPNLERLRLRYCQSWPSQDTLIGLGARFLSNYPKLHEIRLYNPWSKKASYDPLWTQNATGETKNEREFLVEPLEEDDSDNLSPDPLDHAEGKEPVIPVKGEHAPWIELRAMDEEAEAQREVMAAWKRWCPELRELQLVPQYSWRRGSSTDTWTRRLIFWEDISNEVKSY